MMNTTGYPDRRHLLLSFLLVVGAYMVQGQTAPKTPTYVHAEYYSFAEGYRGKAFDFCEDRRGTIWLSGTEIIRFEGASFKRYPASDSVYQTGLGKGSYYALEKDPSGLLWVSGESGVYWYNEVRDSFCLVNAPPTGHWQQCPRSMLLAKDQKHFWLADCSGIFKYDLSRKCWTTIILQTLEKPVKLLEDRLGQLWVADEMNFLYVFDPQKGTLLKKFDNARSLMDTPDGSVWYGSWRRGIHCIDPRSWKELVYYPPGEHEPGTYGEVFAALQVVPSLTGDSVLWCGTMENGIWFFDLHKRRFIQQLNYDERRSTGLPNPSVTGIFVDAGGIVWLAQEGIARITPFRQQLLSQKILGLRPDDARTVHVRNVLPDRFRPGLEWMAVSYYGLVSYDTRKKELEKWWFYPPGKPILKRERNFRCEIAYDYSGNLWATTETGFLVVDKKGKTRNVYLNKINNLHHAIYAIAFDRQNTCWMATDAGLYAYHPSTGRLQTFADEANSGIVSVEDLVADTSGLWLATTKGLAFFDFSTQRFRYFSIQPEGDNHFHAVHRTKSGQIFGLNNKGLATIYEDRLIQVCEVEGSEFTHTRSFDSDTTGHIWVQTYAGLHKIDPRTQYVERFDVDGFGFFNLPSGDMNIVGDNGICTFTPGKLSGYVNTYKPLITLASVFNQRLPVDFDAAERTPVVLNWHQNALSFEFNCPDFTSIQLCTYEVMLEGYDKQWVAQGRKRNASYTNLEPGEYVFKVRSTNMTGIKHPENAVFLFRVLPPFWRTWWFQTLVAGAIAALIYLIFRARVAAVRREEARKTEFYRLKAETETRALRAQMNPHFIFNCMNTIEAFIIEQKEVEATAFLQKFSKLIRCVLENAQHDSIPLEQEIEVLEWYIQLEQIRANHRWAYQIVLDRIPDLKQITVPPLILQPFVENAILHGLHHRRKNGGLLSVGISRNNERLLIAVISDNGIGRAAAGVKRQHIIEKKHSLGIQFTMDRILKLNSPGKRIYGVSISDVAPENEGMTGTRVEIRLPG